MKQGLYKLLVLVLVLVPSAGIGSGFDLGDRFFESVGDAESIPNNNVTALAEGDSGFLWIGTNDGLLRYDGYRFHTVRTDALNGGDFVRSLLVARDGRIWVGTNADGVLVIDPQTGISRRFRHSPTNPASLSDDTVRALAEDADGSILIGTREGLDHWHPQRDTIQRGGLRFADSVPNDEHIAALLVDAEGDLWVGSWNGLSRRRAGQQEFERLFVDEEAPMALSGVVLQSLLALQDGRIAVGTAREGSFLLDPDHMSIQALPVDPDAGADRISTPVLAILQPVPGQLWLGVLGGIDIVDVASGGLLQRVRPDPSVPSSLAHDQVRAMLRDRAGLVWLGGYGGGLQRHDPRNEAIRVLRHSPTRAESISMPSISSVLELSNGQLWLGTRGNGVDILDRQAGLVAAIRPDPSQAEGLRSGVVSALAQAVDGAVWVGTQDGLHRTDVDRSAMTRFGIDQGLPNSYVRRLLASADGTVWIGTDAGLASWTPGAERLRNWTLLDGAPLREDVNALVLQPDGRLWIGTSIGLYTRAPRAEGLQAVRAAPGSEHDLPHPSVLGLLWDESGHLWIDTSAGLARLANWDGQEARFEASGQHMGVAGKPFGANLLRDSLGRIWTQNFMFDPERGASYELSRADGADLGTPWFRSYASTRDGLLLFGGSKGLLVIDPMSFRPWSYTPPVVVTELRIGGEIQPGLGSGERIAVKPGQRGFSVEFAALDFSAPQRNRYAYRLLNFDDEWQEVDANFRVAGYNNLAPGAYELQVRGSGRNGIWSPSVLSVPVEVQPAWWQRRGFALTVLLIGFALLVLMVRQHNRSIRRRAVELQRMVDARTAELTQSSQRAEKALGQLQAAQRELIAREKMASLGQLVAGVAHEINTPVGVALTASTFLDERSLRLQSLIAEGKLGRRDLDAFVQQAHESAQMISNNLMRAANLVRNFKQVSVDRSSDDRRSFGLAECLQAVVDSLQLTWKRRPITLHLECPDDLRMDSYPGALGQIVTNLIQNSLLHGFGEEDSGTMRLSASLVDEGQVLLTFEDDGQGMDSAQLARVFEPFFTTKRAQGGSGLGLHIVYNLVTVKLGGEIQVDGAPGAGMRFRIQIPQVAPL